MASPRDPSWRLKGFARLMRHDPTDAEKLLWSRLRDRRLNGYKVRRQMLIEGDIVNVVCLTPSLALELDGGQHLDASAKQYDQQRTEILVKDGFRIIRFSNLDILQNTTAVLESILLELDAVPSPGVPGVGVNA